MAEKNLRGKIAELGNKQSKDGWFSRFIKMDEASGGKSGEHWSKTEATIDAHQTLYEAGAEVEWSWTKGAEGKGDKLQVYAVKDAAKADSGKRPSAYGKEAAAKDDYWKNKEAFEQARVNRNDKKIELQHYQNLLAPLYLELYKTTEMSVDDVVEALDAKAIILYNRHNPKAPAVEVAAK